MSGFSIPETLYNASEANDLQDWMDEQERHRKDLAAGPDAASYDAPTSLTPSVPATPPVSQPVEQAGLVEQPRPNPDLDLSGITAAPPSMATPPVNAPSRVAGGRVDEVTENRAYADQMARKYGLDPRVFDAQLNQESGFRNSARSPVGAGGPAQFMPETARGMARQMGVTEEQFWADPRIQIEGAAILMRDNLRQYNGDYSLALAAYNAGPGNVAKYGGVPPFEETQRYVRNILGGQPGNFNDTGAKFGGVPDFPLPPRENLPDTPMLPPDSGGTLLSGKPSTSKLDSFIAEQNKRVAAANPWTPPQPSTPESSPGIGDIPEGIRQLTNRLPGPAQAGRAVMAEQQIADETRGVFQQIPQARVPSITEMFGSDGRLTPVGEAFLQTTTASPTAQADTAASTYNTATAASRGNDPFGNPAADRNPQTTAAVLAFSVPLVVASGLYAPEVLSNLVAGNLIDPEGVQILGLLRHAPAAVNALTSLPEKAVSLYNELRPVAAAALSRDPFDQLAVDLTAGTRYGSMHFDLSSLGAPKGVAEANGRMFMDADGKLYSTMGAEHRDVATRLVGNDDPDRIAKLFNNGIARVVVRADMIGFEAIGGALSERSIQNARALALQNRNKLFVADLYDDAGRLYHAEGARGLDAALNTINQANVQILHDHADQIAEKVYGLTTANGGATYNIRGGDLTGVDAWAVGGFGTRTPELKTANTTPATIANYIRTNAEKLVQEGHNIGTWDDEGNMYLDVSRTHQNPETATAIAQANNEKAIMHLGTFEERLTGGTGEAPPRKVPGFGQPAPGIVDVANTYNTAHGLPTLPETWTPVQLAKDTQRRIARWYENTESNPNSNVVKSAYKAFADETDQQWQTLQKAFGGFVAEPWAQDGQPYRSSADMISDVANNHHLYYFTGGDPHPLLSPEENEKFRAVHDFFGHAMYGNEFGPTGEENAWAIHKQMYSPEAQRAMGTETRGQNSWVNYAPQNEGKPWDQKGYAEQKVTLMPDEFLSSEGDLPNRAVRMFREAQTPEEMAHINLDSLPDSPNQVTIKEIGADGQPTGNRIPDPRSSTVDALTLYRAATRFENFKDWYRDLAKYLVDNGLGDAIHEISALIGITSYSAAPEANIPASLRIARRVREILAERPDIFNATEDEMVRWQNLNTMTAEQWADKQAKLVAAGKKPGRDYNSELDEAPANARLFADLIRPAVKYVKGEHGGLNVSDAQLASIWKLYNQGEFQINSGSKAVSFFEGIRNRAAQIMGLEGKQYEQFAPVIDRWIFRVMGYDDSAIMGEGGFPDRYTQYSKSVIKGLADKLGWDPDQVQSALWFAWKQNGDAAYNPTQFRDLKGRNAPQALAELAARGASPLPGNTMHQGGVPALIAASRTDMEALKAAMQRYPDPTTPSGKPFNLRWSSNMNVTGAASGVAPDAGGVLQGAVAGAAAAQIQDSLPGNEPDENRTLKGAVVGGAIGGVLGRGSRRQAASGIPFGGREELPKVTQHEMPGGFQAERPEIGTQPDLLTLPRGPEQVPFPGSGDPPVAGGPNPSPAGVDTRTAWTRDQLTSTPEAAQVAANHGEPARTAAVNAVADLVSSGASDQQVNQFWRKAAATPMSWKDPNGWNQWFKAVSYNSMLSGPGSAQMQILGNSLELPVKVVGDVLRTANNPRALLAEAQGAIEGWRRGARAAGNVLRFGEESAVSPEYNQTHLGDLPGLGGKVGGALESPGRVFGALDSWAIATFQGMEAGRLAGVRASKEGLSGAQWAARAGELQDDPTIIRAAGDAAQRWALKGDMGNLGRALQQVQQVPIVGMITMPFLKTTYHMLSRGVDRSPLGALGTGIDVARGVYSNGKELPQGVRPLGERLADNITGTATLAWAWQQAMDGNITGSGPTDPDERARLQRLGWQPNSVKVGGNWVQYSNLGPGAVGLSAVAAAAESVKYGDPAETQYKTIADATRRWAQATEQNSYLSTFGQLLNLTDPHQDVEQSANRLIAGQAEKLIPGAAAGRAIANAQDPYAREYKSIGDQVGSLNPLPGARNQYPTAEDVYGRPKPANATGLEALTPLRVGAPTEGGTAAVDRELGRLGHNLGMPSKTVSGYELPPAKYREYVETTGPQIQAALSEMVGDPSWQDTPDKRKLELITREVDRIREREGKQLVRELNIEGAAKALRSPLTDPDELGTRRARDR